MLCRPPMIAAFSGLNRRPRSSRSFALSFFSKMCYNDIRQGFALFERRIATVYTPRYHNEQTDLLINALLSLGTAEEAYRFLEDVLTVQELKSITQRLEVAVMLREKVTYQDIAHKTGASTATISRVNRSLQYGADGYALVLDRLQEAQQK